MHVALDGAHHDLADRLCAGLGQQRPQDLERAGHRLAGNKHLGDEEIAALEPRTDLFKRGNQRLVEQCLRAEPSGEPSVGQLKHRRSVPDQGVVVQLAEQLLVRHWRTYSARRLGLSCSDLADYAAVLVFSRPKPEGGTRVPPSTADRASAAPTQAAAVPVIKSAVIRAAGAETEIAAIATGPPAKTGAAT